jgi:hypothetical protein
MFIRKRTKKLKNGNISEKYQAVFSYREGGKVKQEVVALGKYSSAEEYLKDGETYLVRMEKDLSVPLEKYKEIRHSKLFKCPMIAQVPLKVARKRRMELMKKYERQRCKYFRLRKMFSDVEHF